MTNDERRTTIMTVLLLLALSAVVLLTGLGNGSLSSWDEAVYAQISREMLASGDPVGLTWWGSAWSDKPPLYMWGTVLSYKIFGVNEFSARLFSAVSGISVVILMYLFSSLIFSKRTAFISALMLLGTYHFLWFAKMGTLDVTFTLFVFLSIYSFLMAEKKRVFLVYSFLFWGLAFLTKGSGAFLVPIILGVHIFLADKWKLIANRYTLMGILVFMALAGGWCVAAYFARGGAFIKGELIQHLIGRTTDVLDGHSGDWLTYINVILYKGKIWASVGLLVFPFFIVYAFRNRWKKEYMLVAVWVLTVYLVFSVVRTKLHWYIMPIYPAVIAVAGWGTEKILKKLSIPVVLAVTFASLFYFGIKNGIFTLDYNHDVKDFAVKAAERIGIEEKIYLYDISDPGMRFYFWPLGKLVTDEDEFQKAARQEGAVIITNSAAVRGVKTETLIKCGETDYATFVIRD